MEFKIQFKKLRESLELNQTQFSEIIGKSQGDVSELENGKQQPTKTLLVYLHYRYGDMATWGSRGDALIDEYEQGKQMSLVGGPTLSYRPEIDNLMKMGRVILESNTDYAWSLAANIRSFYNAVKTEKELVSCKRSLSDHEKRLIALEGKEEGIGTAIRHKAT